MDRDRAVVQRPNAWLLSLFLVVIVIASCSGGDPGVPGGQAAAKAGGGTAVPAPIEIVQDHQALPSLNWEALSGLSKQEFGTGRADVQSGYALLDVLHHLGVQEAKSVTLYGVGMKPVTLAWTDLENPSNQILLGVTHKGTAKVVAGNTAVLNRDGWIRHLVKLEIHQTTNPPSGGDRNTGRSDRATSEKRKSAP